MKTELAASVLATENGRRADEILRACVHCGFCNSTCPTYQLRGDELDGPRGRIYLIKGMLESGAANAAARTHLDRCLTCRACETTCPSGVRYGALAEIGREMLETHPPPKPRRDIRAGVVRLLLRVVRAPRLFRLVVSLGRAFAWMLPRRHRRMLRPAGGLRRAPARAPRSAVPGPPVPCGRRVLLWQGCAQRAVTGEVNTHLTTLLKTRGFAPFVAEAERCCGGLDLHYGRAADAKAAMRHNVEHLGALDADFVISTASGCGVTLKDYGRLLGGPRAEAFAATVRDVSEVLAGLAFRKRRLAGRELRRVAWHPPCTLQHGQRLTAGVERILAAAGYELAPVADAHLCCGSAGAYSLLQPAVAGALARRKARELTRHGPDAVATANIGCQMHLAAALDAPVLHWVELLA